jgi:hypothetical protein
MHQRRQPPTCATAFRGLEKGDHVEPDAKDVATDDDLVTRAIDVAVQRRGFSHEEARERLARTAAELELDPVELALLVLSGQRCSHLAAAAEREATPPAK